MRNLDDFPLFTSPYASPYDLSPHAYPFGAYDHYGQLVAPEFNDDRFYDYLDNNEEQDIQDSIEHMREEEGNE